MSKEKITIDYAKATKAAKTLQAICHPLRLQMLALLDGDEASNVSKIYTVMQIEQSIASQHLRLLRLADLVKTTREGKFIHYKIDYQKIDRLVKSVRTFLEQE